MEDNQLSLRFMIKSDLPAKTLLRVDEVAKFFDVSTKTVYTWCEIGIIKSCNPNGGALRIFREGLIEMMEKSMK